MTTNAEAIVPPCPTCDTTLEAVTPVVRRCPNCGTAASFSPPVDPRAASLADCIESAWLLIANASGGNWERESPEWQSAAAAWRDQWLGHAATAASETDHA